ncbi:DUF2273 domain-containing protein [Antrihabitans sp. YC2-6]|uniref:DUF2273 domain-containing protein n=1 Tax=Antrihabitans sp. YC2-6 TaxID=2799498 RepID=UPI0018F5221B|nr:DUF2273 domain-containing protein [Antrihabitans sp. YC2-6]MBJ8348716.1 DUF2273 domain-containing protein [Antrihabitans sp. YC2-6]
MNSATLGLFAGILLALAGIVGGFGGFLFALVLGCVGLAVGAHRDGTIDLGALLRGRGRG